jgi:hypothetical protein
LWDFTYCIVSGLRVADRRAWQERLLHEFLDHLRAHGVDERELDPERAALEVQLLTLVDVYNGLVIYDAKLWAGQGNTQQDIRAWGQRLLQAGIDVDAAAVAAAIRVPADDMRRLQEYFHGRLQAQ